MHVVFGVGPVGRALVSALEARGEPVRSVSRGPAAGRDHRVGDVANPRFVAEACAGAEVVYQCLNAPYHRWDRFPALQEAVLAGAKGARARLVSFENVYGYGVVDGPMTEDLPMNPCSAKGAVRARMIARLRAEAHGGLDVSHVRASDLFGPGMSGSALGDEVIGRSTRGSGPRALGDLQAPHTWTYTVDAGETLAAAGLAASTGTFHVPSDAPRSFEEVTAALSALLGRPLRITASPPWLLRLVGWVRPEAAELVEMMYEFDRPFVVADDRTRAALGVTHTPFAEALAATVASLRMAA